MGEAMTGAAAREISDDRLGVGDVVAFLTGRDGLVSAGMTVGAQNIAVLGSTAAEHGINFLMTGTAVLGGRIGCKADLKGHMGLVAFLTGLVGHTFQVRAVAVETRGQVAMTGVTGRAVKCGMDGWVFLELLQLTVMAGGARGGNGSGQGDS